MSTAPYRSPGERDERPDVEPLHVGPRAEASPSDPTAIDVAASDVEHEDARRDGLQSVSLDQEDGPASAHQGPGRRAGAVRVGAGNVAEPGPGPGRADRRDVGVDHAPNDAPGGVAAQDDGAAPSGETL